MLENTLELTRSESEHGLYLFQSPQSADYILWISPGKQESIADQHQDQKPLHDILLDKLNDTKALIHYGSYGYIYTHYRIVSNQTQ